MASHLEEALTALKNAACDLTSIEVQTYVGDIDVVVKDQTGSTSFEDALRQAKEDGKMKLKLVTKLNMDGDGIVLVPESAPAGYIQEAHNAALKSGNEVRQGMISLFADVIGLKTR